MPESRYRLERPFDIEQAFARLGSGTDKPPAGPKVVATPAAPQGQLGHWGVGRGTEAPIIFRTSIRRGWQNMPLATGSSSGRRVRADNRLLPSGYSRTPFRDITAIIRAMGWRRAGLGDENNGETGEGQVPSPHFQDDPPELEVPTTTPTIKTRPCPPPSVRKLQKILLEVANEPDEGEFLTPQKKLLNSIDKVEKVMLEELQRLKRTPSAKKAEGERRVRTLMSMR